MPEYYIEDNFNGPAGPIHGTSPEIWRNPPDFSSLESIYIPIIEAEESIEQLVQWVASGAIGGWQRDGSGRAIAGPSQSAIMSLPGSMFYDINLREYVRIFQRILEASGSDGELSIELLTEALTVTRSQRVGPHRNGSWVEDVRFEGVTDGNSSLSMSVQGGQGINSFGHGGIIQEYIGPVGGSSGTSGWRLRTNGFFYQYWIDIHDFYRGYDVAGDGVRRGFSLISYYVSQNNVLPPSLQNIGLQGPVFTGPTGLDGGLQGFSDHFVWSGIRDFVVVFDDPPAIPRLGKSIDDGSIEFFTPASSRGFGEVLPLVYDSGEGSWDYPLGTNRALLDRGTMFGPSSSKPFAWNSGGIDLSDISVPVTPGAHLILDRACPNLAGVIAGTGSFWSPDRTGLTSFGKYVGYGDSTSGGSGWKVGSIATGGSGGGLSFGNYYMYTVIMYLAGLGK